MAGRRGGGGELALEKKIVALEQRLVLMERFVEMRFCETFRDFSIRNLGSGQATAHLVPENSDISNSSSPQKGRASGTRGAGGEKNLKREPVVSTQKTATGRESTAAPSDSSPVRRTRSSGRSQQEAPSTGDIGATSNTRQLRVRVTRMEDTKVAEDENEDPEEVVIKVAPTSPGEDAESGQEEDYFTFPSGHEGGDGGDEEEYPENVEIDAEEDDDDPMGADALDPDDDDWNEGDGEEQLPTSSRKRALKPKPGGVPPKKRSRTRKASDKLSLSSIKIDNLKPVNPSSLKECPLCHTHWKPDQLPAHMESSHLKERHLQCSFCDKRFFNRKNLLKHERVHQPEKYGKKCRIPSCRLKDKIFTVSDKLLTHERLCIRRALLAEEEVDPEILEDVKKRSTVNLDWLCPVVKEGEGVGGSQKQCQICNKWFEKDHWERHLKTHTDWKCDYCEGNKVFKTKYRLKRHLHTVHGVQGNEEGGGEEDESRQEQEEVGGDEEVTVEEQEEGSEVDKAEETDASKSTDAS